MKKLNKGIEFFLVLLFGLAIVVSFVQIIFRYVLNNTLVWSDELTRYIFILVFFVGAAFAGYRDEHIKLDMIPAHFVRTRKGLRIVIDLITAIFLIFLIYLGFEHVVDNMGEKSPALQIPIGIPYLAIPIGCACSLFYIGVRYWKKGEVDE
jgi:TRAP-type C4-dicarboxylate transport system permease small subunit